MTNTCFPETPQNVNMSHSVGHIRVVHYPGLVPPPFPSGALKDWEVQRSYDVILLARLILFVAAGVTVLISNLFVGL